MWAAVPPVEQPPFTHPPTFTWSSLSTSWRSEGGEDRHSSVWLLCWALAGKRAGSINNVLFGVEDARLSGGQGYHWAEHVLLSLPTSSGSSSQQTPPVPVQPLFISSFHYVWGLFPLGLLSITSTCALTQVLWEEDRISFAPSYLSWVNLSHQLSPTWPLVQTTPSAWQLGGEL